MFSLGVFLVPPCNGHCRHESRRLGGDSGRQRPIGNRPSEAAAVSVETPHRFPRRAIGEFRLMPPMVPRAASAGDRRPLARTMGVPEHWLSDDWPCWLAPWVCLPRAINGSTCSLLIRPAGSHHGCACRGQSDELRWWQGFVFPAGWAALPVPRDGEGPPPLWGAQRWQGFVFPAVRAALPVPRGGEGPPRSCPGVDWTCWLAPRVCLPRAS